MSQTLIITGSPSGASKTAKLANLVGARLARSGIDSTWLDVRSLPAEDLLLARVSAPAIRGALEQVQAARGVIIATPVYKAAYSGLLKTFLDLLPQFALRDKVVLPLATGGTVAHVLAIDYALRPVLSSLDPLHVVPGLFVLDKQIVVKDDGTLDLDADLSAKLDVAITNFRNGFHRAVQEVPVH
jgi:FMN reductase